MTVRDYVFVVLGMGVLATPLLADTLWVPTIHLVESDGDHISRPVPGSEYGMSRSECEVRAQTWGAQLARANALAGSRQSGAMQVTCERR